MDYCVTGGLGVIGSLIAKSKARTGHVEIIDDGVAPRNRANAFDECELVSYRLGTHDDVIELHGDRILNAAASTGIPYSTREPLDDWSRNVDGTLEVLEALVEKPRPTVILSSVKPYATTGLTALERLDHYNLSGRAIDESCLLAPDEPYAASKASQSLIAQAYARSYDLPIVVFRCSNLFGPACCHGARHGWLTYFCIQAALGRTIEIQGTGKQTRDMLFWSDVESACDYAWSAVAAGDIENGRIYNLGGGSDNLISPLQAVEELRKLGASFDVRSGPGREHEDMLFCTDSSAAIRELGWERKVSVRDGLAEVYEWAKAQRDVLAEVYKE